MRIGIIGLGSIGTRHMTNLASLGGHQLAGYDPALTEPGFHTLESFWAWNPEAVLICTPPEHHYDYAAMAIRARIHVFIEKPITQDQREADHLLHIAKQYKVQLAVGYQLRWLLDEHYGRVSAGKDAYFESRQDMSKWPSQYKKDPLEEFSHEIDLAVHIYGPVEAVAMHQVNNSCMIRLRHIDASSGIFLDWGSKEFKRNLIVDGKPVWEFHRENNDNAYKLEIQAFVAACEGKGFDYRLCGGAQAAHVVQIIEACRLSANTCSVVGVGV